MPDCDYCGQDFEGEEAYLDHLADEHYEDLSRIDRRRVDQRETESDTSTTQLAIAGVVVSGVVLLAAFYFLNGGLPGLDGEDERPPAQSGEVIPEGIESRPLDGSGDASLLEGTQTSQPASNDHVPDDTDVDYDTIPPVGGAHYRRPAPVDFYEQRVQLPRLVHNLEHGHVVIYYDPSAITPAAEDSLRRFVDQYRDPWAAVVAVPNPRDDPSADYVLTAWGAKLELNAYDARVIHAFMSEYLGRGPENPVRRVGAPGPAPAPTA